MVAFNNTYTNAALANQNYLNSIAAAEQFISSNWTNSITLNIRWDVQNAGTNTFLATNSWPNSVNVSYTTLRNALISHANNPDAQLAVATLPATDPTGGHTWSLPEAYARMLGLSSQVFTPDDTVTLNTSYSWAYNGDVTATLVHELTEGGMGRVGGLGDQNSAWSTLDLFRYSAAGVRDFTDGRDGKTTYFSVDGSTLMLPFHNQWNFGTHVDGGDPADFNVLDPFGFGQAGSALAFSTTDFKVMNILGWTPVTVGPPVFSAAGDFNSNGLPDFVWRRAGSAQMGMWEYNPTAQAVTSTVLGNGTVPSSWAIISSSHFTNSGTSQMLMDYVPNGTMTLWWVNGSGQLVGSNLGPNWANVGYVGAGQFNRSLSGNGITSFLVADGAHNLYDWWIGSNGTLTGYNLGAYWSGVQLVTTGNFDNHSANTEMLVANPSDGHLYEWWIGANSLLTGYDLGGYWSGVQLVTTGQFDNHSAFGEMLVSNPSDGHLYEWWIGTNGALTGYDLGGYWSGVQLVTVGHFDNHSAFNELLVANPSNGHLYEWWIATSGALTGYDLGAYWSGMQLIGNSHYNNNSANNELLVRNTANGEFYEWWIAASGALTGVNLGTAAGGSAADGIGAGAIVDSGSLVLANSTSGLANNSTGSANMPPAGGSTFASSAATSIDGEMPGAAASTDSTSLLVQSMASFGASEAIAASSSTLVGAGPAQSEIAAPTDPRFAHAT